MRKYIYILFVAILVLSGCTKVEKTPTSGTDTIDNTTYLSTTYYVYGFLFSKAGIASTLDHPGPDITVYVNSDNVTSRLTFQASNLNPSFFKVGEFVDEATAIEAFNNLKSFSAAQWTDMADPIAPNQIWIYRTGSEKYAKIRIINIVNEIRQNIAYGECKFQWVYQADGSTTFSTK